jgi:CheY-like chemotaxis protein/curved DNA-binding protein CbpA
MGNRILVVDDDLNIGQILHASLAAKGFEVYVTRNGEDALKQFDALKPNLVLLDVLLPKMNGWDVCKTIKARPDGEITPVMLMSAVYKTPKMQHDAKVKYRADAFVEKPFQLSRLIEDIVGMIGEPPPPDKSVQKETVEGEVAEAPPPAKEPIALDGDLSSVSFPELLHDLYVMGKSGRLMMKSQDKVKEVEIMGGYPVCVNTSLPGEYLGNFLVRMRIISEEQAVESVKLMQSSNRLQGTILMEMGLLTPQQLVNYLKMQVREKLFEIFSWRDGTYKFTQDESVKGDIQNVDMSVANIISEGVRLFYDYDRLVPLTKHFGQRFLHLGGNRRYRFQELQMSQAESHLVDFIDGTKSFEETVSKSSLPLERTLQVLYTMIVSGMVEPIAESTDDPQTALSYGKDIVHEARELAKATQEEKKTEKTGERKAKKESPPNVIILDGPEPSEPAAPVINKKEPVAESPKPEETPPEQPEIGGDGEDAKARRRVLEIYKRLTTDNLFELLAVTENPTEQEVRLAYHKLAKEFHPDRFFGRASTEVKGKVEEIFRAVNEAYDRLNTQEKIINFKEELAGIEPEKKESSRIRGVKDIISAEQKYQAGLEFLKEKRFTRAARALGEALEIAPNEAEYLAYYAWSLYNIPYEKDADEEELQLRPNESMADLQFEARESLSRALEINPRCEKAYLFLGAIYKRQGLSEFAEKQYEKALICNPNSVEALRELRLIKLKEQQASQKKTSFFERLFKKKTPTV